jgi:hypothetical protein
MRFTRLQIALFILLSLQLEICCALQLDPWKENLKLTLSSQGFSGELQGRVSFNRLGVLKCGTKSLEVVFYGWEETKPPGKAIHASYRVLFLESGEHYLGSYVVGDRPTLRNSRALVFDYPRDLGNIIGCNENGLPSRVQLNGELEELAK